MLAVCFGFAYFEWLIITVWYHFVELFNTDPTYYLIPPMVVNGQAAHGLLNHHVIEKQRQNKIVVYAIFYKQVGLPITNVDHEVSELRVSKAAGM